MDTTQAALRQQLESAGVDVDQAARDADAIFELIAKTGDAASVYQNHLYEYVREFEEPQRCAILRAIRAATESRSREHRLAVAHDGTDDEYLPFGVCTGIAMVSVVKEDG